MDTPGTVLVPRKFVEFQNATNPGLSPQLRVGNSGCDQEAISKNRGGNCGKTNHKRPGIHNTLQGRL
jgi:hypothetical protein